MHLKLCKLCQTRLPDAEPEAICDDCHGKIRQKRLRLGSCLLSPIWLPFWVAGSVFGTLWDVSRRGYQDGLRTVRDFCDAWNPK